MLKNISTELKSKYIRNIYEIKPRRLRLQIFIFLIFLVLFSKYITFSRKKKTALKTINVVIDEKKLDDSKINGT